MISRQNRWALGLILLSASSLVVPSAEAQAPLEGAEEVCPINNVETLLGRLEHLERQVLLTRYADAVEGLRALQREMTCVPEPPEAGVLGRLFLNMGYALHRLGLVSDGEQAFAVAAGIDPSLTWNTTFAASYGVKYYEIAQQVRNGPTVDLKVAPVDAVASWYIDGLMQRPGTTLATVHPGWHFIQVAQEGKWVGDWYNLQGEVSLNLAGLIRRLDPDVEQPEAEAAVPVDTSVDQNRVAAVEVEGDGALPLYSTRNLWATSVTSLAAGTGILLGSIRVAGRAENAYEDLEEMATDGKSQEEINQATYDTYAPLVQTTNGMRAAGGALVGVGLAVGLGAALGWGESGVARFHRERSVRLVAGPGSLGLSGHF